jgi:hypothetical protein
MISRRHFVFTGATLASAVALSASAMPAARVFGSNPGLDQLSYAALRKCLGTAFVVHHGGSGPAVALELIDARQQPPSRGGSADAPDAGHEKFSLRFRGPRRQALPQRTYTFEHRQLGRFEMFIVPAGAQAGANMHYEAIFNRPARRLGAA